MANRRWKCRRCDSGVLAPSRPRSDDVRRFCLPCSEKTGRLVQRYCPSLEKERAKKRSKKTLAQAKAAARQSKKNERSRKAQAFFRRAKRLKCWAGDVKHATLYAQEKRDKRAPYANRTPGTAYPHSGKITITVGFDEADMQGTILHEMAHIAQGCRQGTADHGDGFRSVYLEAVREIVGDDFTLSAKGLGHVYYMDCDVTEALRVHNQRKTR